MIYAKDTHGQRFEPSPAAKGVCPSCGEEVIAKCGQINRWHWSHRGDTDCDAWSEHETEWHLDWKDYFSKAEQEVVMGPHRADVRTKGGRVIELQHSPISVDEIREREWFYGTGMVWVVDASEFIQNLDFRDKGDYSSFWWKWPRKTWSSACRPVYLDPGYGQLGRYSEELFRLRKMGNQAPCGGWGQWGCKWDFVRFFSVEFVARERARKQLMSDYYATVGGGKYATR